MGLEETKGVPGPKEVPFLGKFMVESRGRGSRFREQSLWAGTLVEGGWILVSRIACVTSIGVPGI